jgi:hypothetical protein
MAMVEMERVVLVLDYSFISAGTGWKFGWKLYGIWGFFSFLTWKMIIGSGGYH